MRLLPDFLRNYETPGRINGSPHGIHCTIEFAMAALAPRWRPKPALLLQDGSYMVKRVSVLPALLLMVLLAPAAAIA